MIGDKIGIWCIRRRLGIHAKPEPHWAGQDQKHAAWYVVRWRKETFDSIYGRVSKGNNHGKEKRDPHGRNTIRHWASD